MAICANEKKYLSPISASSQDCWEKLDGFALLFSSFLYLLSSLFGPEPFCLLVQLCCIYRAFSVSCCVGCPLSFSQKLFPIAKIWSYFLLIDAVSVNFSFCQNHFVCLFNSCCIYRTVILVFPPYFPFSTTSIAFSAQFSKDARGFCVACSLPSGRWSPYQEIWTDGSKDFSRWAVHIDFHFLWWFL